MSTKKRLSQVEIEKCIELFKKGHSFKSISRIIGCAPNTAKRNLNLLGFQYQSKYDTELMVAAYMEHKNFAEVARQFGCNGSAARKIISKAGIKNLGKEHLKVQASVLSQIIPLYAQELSLKQVATVLEISENTVKRFLDKSGVVIRNARPHGHKKKCQKYTEIFPGSDSKLGYICGLLATDGSLDGKSTVIRISLQGRDYSTLEFIAKELALEGLGIYEQKVSNPNGFQRQSFYSINATLPKLYQYCLDMGITPAKTYTLDPKLDDKSEEFLWYFLRGVIDGDGSVYVAKTYGGCRIRVTSASKAFADKLAAVYGGKIYTRSKDTRKKGPIQATCDLYDITFGAVALRKMLHKLPVGGFTMARKSEKLRSVEKLQADSKPQNRKAILSQEKELQ